jgi:hypothetical protein
MTSIDEPMVAGSSAFALFKILKRMEFGPEEHGLVRVSLGLDKHDQLIFVRAFERVDAELRADDRLGLTPNDPDRTPKQRRYDSLQLLIEQTLAAVEAYNLDHSQR